MDASPAAAYGNATEGRGGVAMTQFVVEQPVRAWRAVRGAAAAKVG